MVGGPDKKDIGTKKSCRFCGAIFTVGNHSRGGTFIYCPSCSFLMNRKNYGKLTKTQKKALRNLQREYTRKYYRANRDKYLARGLAYVKEWKKENPERKQLQKKRYEQKCMEETFMLAENHNQPWDSEAIEYLKEKAGEMTSRELATTLGRTYYAIIGRASLEGIKLMTEDKRHGRLKT